MPAQHSKAFPIRGMAVLLTALALPQARADFLLIEAKHGLSRGGGGTALHASNSTSSGNMGMGGAGRSARAGGCAAPCMIGGNIRSSNADTGQYGINSGATGAAVKALHALSSSAESVTELSDSGQFPAANASSYDATSDQLRQFSGSGQFPSANASWYDATTDRLRRFSGSGQFPAMNTSGGTLDANGNRVFDVSSFNFNNGTTLIINGDAADDSVVFNFTHNTQSGGSNVLNGLTSDQVLSNIGGGMRLTGGSTLHNSTKGAGLTGGFLDPNGAISIDHSTHDTRLFEGDSHTLHIVSGVTPSGLSGPTPTPEPVSIVLFGTVLVACGTLARRRFRH
jgi:hypothetical protein